MASTPAEGMPKTDACKDGQLKEKTPEKAETYVATNIVHAPSACNLLANELKSRSQHIQRDVNQWFRRALVAFHQESVDEEVVVQKAEIQRNQTSRNVIRSRRACLPPQERRQTFVHSARTLRHIPAQEEKKGEG